MLQAGDATYLYGGSGNFNNPAETTDDGGVWEFDGASGAFGNSDRELPFSQKHQKRSVTVRSSSNPALCQGTAKSWSLRDVIGATFVTRTGSIRADAWVRVCVCSGCDDFTLMQLLIWVQRVGV